MGRRSDVLQATQTALGKSTDFSTRQRSDAELESIVRDLSPSALGAFLEAVSATDTVHGPNALRSAARCIGLVATHLGPSCVPHLPSMASCLVRFVEACPQDTALGHEVSRAFAELTRCVLGQLETDVSLRVLLRPLFRVGSTPPATQQARALVCIGTVVEAAPPCLMASGVLDRVADRVLGVVDASIDKGGSVCTEAALGLLGTLCLLSTQHPGSLSLQIHRVVGVCVQYVTCSHWQTRCAAARLGGVLATTQLSSDRVGVDTHQAAATRAHLQQIEQALEGARFDRISHVREAVLESLDACGVGARAGSGGGTGGGQKERGTAGTVKHRGRGATSRVSVRDRDRDTGMPPPMHHRVSGEEGEGQPVNGVGTTMDQGVLDQEPPSSLALETGPDQRVGIDTDTGSDRHGHTSMSMSMGHVGSDSVPGGDTAGGVMPSVSVSDTPDTPDTSGRSDTSVRHHQSSRDIGHSHQSQTLGALSVHPSLPLHPHPRHIQYQQRQSGLGSLSTKSSGVGQYGVPPSLSPGITDVRAASCRVHRPHMSGSPHAGDLRARARLDGMAARVAAGVVPEKGPVAEQLNATRSATEAVRRLVASLEGVLVGRMDALEAGVMQRVDGVEERLGQVETRVEGLEKRVAQVPVVGTHWQTDTGGERGRYHTHQPGSSQGLGQTYHNHSNGQYPQMGRRGMYMSGSEGLTGASLAPTTTGSATTLHSGAVPHHALSAQTHAHHRTSAHVTVDTVDTVRGPGTSEAYTPSVVGDVYSAALSSPDPLSVVQTCIRTGPVLHLLSPSLLVGVVRRIAAALAAGSFVDQLLPWAEALAFSDPSLPLTLPAAEGHALATAVLSSVGRQHFRYPHTQDVGGRLLRLYP
ncbi:hypothetical protein KIPB_000911 [Kipferlia bialata]|uniref:TORTIFOLIA1/SINE1-2 N-terminal domain-containing protein n=1 Tax=Kipferlia bialata TaxID=797122 RepID=A0A9K3GDT8_9EUKA|nr:hypothetical protein KIPB_000911 [Kipferlia bialata]|eukprot:g911.t1